MLVRLILNQMAGSDLDGLQLGRASRKRTPEKALVDAVLNCIRTMRRVRDDENSCDVLDFVDLRKCMGAVWPNECEEQCDAHEVVHRLVGLVCTRTSRGCVWSLPLHGHTHVPAFGVPWLHIPSFSSGINLECNESRVLPLHPIQIHRQYAKIYPNRRVVPFIKSS